MKFGKTAALISGLVFGASAAQAYNGLYEVEVTGLQGLNILEGTTVWQPSPIYPSMALRRGLEGQVLVEYTINEQGKAQDIRILDAQPRGFFNNVTVNALENATFGVAYDAGEPVAVEGIKKRFIYLIEEDDSGAIRPAVAVN